MLERLPPLAVVAVPVDRRGERVVERSAQRPARERGELADVDRIAAVVPETIVDRLDERVVASGEREQPRRQLAVGQLVAGTDVVDLAGHTLLEHELRGDVVVLDVDPVADVETVAVQRHLAAVEQVRGEERDDLLGELVRARSCSSSA